MATELTPSRPTTRRSRVPAEVRALREALAPYIDVPTLRRLASDGADLQGALVGNAPPPEVTALLATLATLLRPTAQEQVRSPSDVAALLMVEMGHLTQEEFRVVHLTTKNNVQSISTLYRGTLDTAQVRVGEVFREALRLNSASIIIAHEHPSGCPDPSPEDILITRQIIEAGKLLDVELLDSLVIGRGRWISMREKGLAFGKEPSEARKRR